MGSAGLYGLHPLQPTKQLEEVLPKSSEPTNIWNESTGDLYGPVAITSNDISNMAHLGFNGFNSTDFLKGMWCSICRNLAKQLLRGM